MDLTSPQPFPKIPKVPTAERRDRGAHAQTHTGNSPGCQREEDGAGGGGPKALTVGVSPGLRDGGSGFGRQARRWGVTCCRYGRTQQALTQSCLLLSSKQARQRPLWAMCLTKI